MHLNIYYLDRIFQRFRILLLFSLIVSASLYSQVIIRESIKINPDMQKKSLSKTLSGDKVLALYFFSNNHNYWSVSVTGPCNVADSTRWNGSSYDSIKIVNPPAGNYTLYFTQKFPNGGRTAITFDSYYSDVEYISSGELLGSGCIIQGDEEREEETRSCNLSKLSYDNDYDIQYINSICSDKVVNRPTLVTFNNGNCADRRNTAGGTSISITKGAADLVFCDDQGVSYGSEISSELYQTAYKIKLNTPYYGSAYNAIMTFNVNGIVKTAEIPVYPATKVFCLGTDEPTAINLVHGMTKDLTVKSVKDGDCNEEFPDSSITYTLNITEGANYGHLKDSKSGRTGTNLQNVEHFQGIASFQYIADGDIPVNDEKILVNVSANDVNIRPFDIEIYLHPNNINVSFSPSSIKPNDTSDIVLKYRDSVGVWKDFPEYNVFTFSLVQGQEYGSLEYKFRNMFWIGDLKNLEGALHVKFAAVANMTVSSAKTDLLVSTYKDGQTIWGSGSISIGSSGCGSAPKCNTPPELPKVGLKENKNGFDGYDGCGDKLDAVGYFHPIDLKKNYLADFQLDVCYNETTDNWQFKVVGGSLYFNVIKDICDDNVRSHHMITITDTAQLKTLDSLEAFKAYDDFNYQKTYGHHRANGYFLYKASLAHEGVHEKKYIALLNSYFDNTYSSRFKTINIKCDDNVNDIIKAQKVCKDSYISIMDEYKDVLQTQWSIIEGQIGSETRDEFEIATQKSEEVQNTIGEYTKYLENLYPSLKSKQR
jgi:hypothetical protein